ncbi:MAG: Glycosyl transferase family 2 [Candidatus Daviesbacteria bacterium GW2011_GWA1_41_61]|uniref:Glycosyl transferase family 2 n=1 Tax=Candidatus Daviesbacteria bacterium GW2011_GWA2_40_9 TaxID=1618424 RepID=A0A0G0U786_9BACT|nr:MAG: hypothetical protein UU26_C0006G0004 [Candidatus Daviesbacteria bacterium GW2011_GWC1_40_9]KKR83061.1 MAG: Glycosyl transferase family 2 [Candidatus Daviesbacteria bacterium GW2011_GWA2_40_9]KKR92985.1 MAG: Glycosyl transferase family 2 [Candidatus Daviesbacteria bacterium GW2011_GWB1_41_15]KKS15529.1 MAG: Glycosyl transferase family 2 [Candidatus Daviesbacteria bacterium GW2011_GWA1_41_61]
MSKSLVSVIIINWNGGEVFKNCLQSLSKIDYQNWELIVVDNGSSDDSQLLVTQVKLPYKRNQLIQNNLNLGFALANNQGAKKAQGKYLLLLNNDTMVEPNFLSKMVTKMEADPSLGVLQPKICLMDKPDYLDNAGSFLTKIGFWDHWGFLEKDGVAFSKEREIFSAKGACMLIRKEVIDKVGLFDEDFVSYFEESDFCWRVWLAGYKVLFYPQVKIYHKVGFTIKRLDVFDINYHYYKNRICSLIQNLETKNLLTVFTSHLFISVGIAVVFLLRRNLNNFFMVFRAILWNVFNLPKILSKRSLVQKMRVVGDDELFAWAMHGVDWRKHFGDFKRVEGDLKRNEKSN